MPNPATARYRDAAGGWHDVVVRQTAEDAWEIVDVAADAHADRRHAARLRRRPPAGCGRRPRLRRTAAPRTG